MSNPRNRSALVWIAVALAALVALFFLLRPGVPPASRAAPEPAPGDRGASSAARPAPLPPSADVLVRLEGRVVDLKDNGIPGAEVRLAARTFTTTTRTDGQGAFTFSGLHPDLYFIDAATQDAACKPRRIHLRADTPPVLLRLSWAIRAEITVVAADDEKPIPGAVVEVLDRNSDTPLRSELTDKAGKVALHGLPPDGYGVTVSAAGFRTAKEALPPRAGLGWSHTIRLARGVAVRGRVIDDRGTGVQAATVQPLPPQDVLFLATPKLGSHTVLTDANGEFTITLDPGRFRLAATHPRYVAGRSEVFAVATAPLAGIVIRVDAGGSIAGQVVTAEGTPAAYATVRSSASLGSDVGQGMRDTRADSDGRFLIEGLPRVPLDIVAMAPAASSDTVKVDLAARRSVTDLVVRLGFDAVIAGMVQTTDHRPVMDADVFCVGKPHGAVGTRPIFGETTDAQGRFTCRGLVPGEYALTATRPYPNNNQGPQARSVSLPAVKTGTTNVVIVLPEDGALVGQVRLADGSAAHRFGVSVDAGGGPRRFEDSKDGRFVLDGLAPKTYKVRVEAEGFIPAVVEDVRVPAGGRVDVGVVTLNPARLLQFR